MPHSVSPSPTVCSRRRAADGPDRLPLDDEPGRAVDDPDDERSEADADERSPDARLADGGAGRLADDSLRVLLAVVEDARGMRSVWPGRMVSASMSLAARTASTVVS